MPNPVQEIRLSELINPTPRQKEFLDVAQRVGFPFYGGAAGGGKSYICQWFLVLILIKAFVLHGIKGAKVGLFCETYGALQDRHTSSWKIPKLLGEIKNTEADGWRFKLKDIFGGGIILLRNLDKPDKYDSTEFIAIAVDEFVKNDFKVFNQLRKRLRWPTIADKPHLPCGGSVTNSKGIMVDCPIASHHTLPKWNYPFAVLTNPGGISHAQVKQLWIDRDFPPELKPIAHEFVRVQAKHSDNPYNPPDYYDKNLATLPDDLRKAYADGDWNIFAGQYFKEWRDEVHVCEPFEIPWYWKIRRCGDWGEAKPCAIYWIATSPEGKRYVIGEVYGAGLSIEEQSKRIHAFEARNNVEPVGFLDEACWDKSGREKSIAQQYLDNGVRWVPCKKGPGSRIAGWQVFRKELAFKRGEDGQVTKEPNMRFFSTCKNAIRTIPSLVHDPNNVEDLDSDGEDHAADAIRYGLMGKNDHATQPLETMHPDSQEAMINAER